MADTYKNFAELEAATVYGVDYTINTVNHPTSDISIVAIHGGGIEVGTTEVTLAAAKDIASSYVFEALRTSGNADLHITSANYDEPQAVGLVTSKQRAISLHGYSDEVNKRVLIGGLDIELRESMETAFVSAGFDVIVADKASGVAGVEPMNIVNRCISGAGVQLELSTALRKALFVDNNWSRPNRVNTTQTFTDFVNVIRKFILNN